MKVLGTWYSLLGKREEGDFVTVRRSEELVFRSLHARLIRNYIQDKTICSKII